MQSDSVIEEARRVMTFCNACRYCEGFCAVFPAMELRREFSEQDLNYLANLCHNCRDCYYACQYAPPHEFDLNIPQTMAEYRLKTYRDHCWPQQFKDLFRNNIWMVTLITLISIIGIIGALFVFRGKEMVFSSHAGSGAFYDLIPYEVMVAVPAVMASFALISLAVTFGKFWRRTNVSLMDLLNPKPHIIAVSDVMRLKYLEGGGGGCNYPDERFSMIRRWLHHMVFYGVLLCFTATVIAACYEHFLHIKSPFGIFSLPVVLGTIGGVVTLIGTAGLLYLKPHMNSKLTTEKSTQLDITFLVLLLMTNLTGLLLLAFRETSAMAMLLCVHLGFVACFFLTAPYGKFVHAILRYAALVKHAAEQLQNH